MLGRMDTDNDPPTHTGLTACGCPATPFTGHRQDCALRALAAWPGNPPEPDYAPDPAAVDALVDSDGQPTPDRQVDPADLIDAADVTATLAAFLDLAESYLVFGTGTVEDRMRLWVALTDAIGRDGSLPTIRKTMAASLAADLDGPVEVDGVWYNPARSKSVTGWDKAAVRSAVNRAVMAAQDDDPKLVDRSTGEPVDGPPAAVLLERIWRFVDVATGRTKVLADAGIDPDDYATVTWSDTVEKMRDRPAPTAGR